MPYSFMLENVSICSDLEPQPLDQTLSLQSGASTSDLDSWFASRSLSYLLASSVLACTPSPRRALTALSEPSVTVLLAGLSSEKLHIRDISVHFLRIDILCGFEQVTDLHSQMFHRIWNVLSFMT